MKIRSDMLFIRRILFAVMIVAAAAACATKGFVPQIRGVSAFVLIPLVVSIAMFEKSVPSLLFGTFAGIMWDMYSITADGFFSVMLSAVGFLTAMIILFYMRNNIASAVALSFVWTLIISTLYWLNFILMSGTASAFYIYLRYYLPVPLYTAVFTFIFYYIVKVIFEKTTPERKRINY